MRPVLAPAVAAVLIGLLAACDVSGRGSSDHPPPETMPSAADRPQEDEVRALIEARIPGARYAWNKLMIDNARHAMPNEVEAARLPANAIVWPVYANFTATTAAGARDFHWGYYLYKAEDGRWAVVSDVLPGKYDSGFHPAAP